MGEGKRGSWSRSSASSGGPGHRPSWPGGVAAPVRKKVRSIRSGADGVVVQVQKHFCLILDHHPVRSIKGSFAIFLLMSRPPSWPGGAMSALCRDKSLKIEGVGSTLGVDEALVKGSLLFQSRDGIRSKRRLNR